MFGGRKAKRLLSILLVLVMVAGFLPTRAQAALASGQAAVEQIVSSLSPERYNASLLSGKGGRPSGLYGFSGDYSLDGEDETVSVIVEFVNQPAKVAQILAAVEDNAYLSLDKAEKLAESDYTNFVSDLQDRFSVKNFADNAANARSAYKNSYSLLDEAEITHIYTETINGVALTLPADRVQELAELESVYAVYPDLKIYAGPGEAELGAETAVPPSGLYNERNFMGVDELHSAGITGKGITVGIMDTGVDYNHPDLRGAFKGYQGSDSRSRWEIGGVYYGRNFFDPNNSRHRENDPMETTYQDWVYAGSSGVAADYYTAHGTHVSGIIAARGEDENSARGMAPEATLIVYRVLGPYGEGDTSMMLAAMDVVADDGVDVINMSLGIDWNDPFYVSCLAVNNLILAEDIVVCLAAGNAGDAMGTVGVPAAATLAITVGNGSADTKGDILTAKAGADTEALLYTLFSNDGGFEKNDNGTYSLLNTSLKPNENHEYKLVPIYDTVENNGTLSIGVESDYTPQIKSQLNGNIAVIRRGQEFYTSMQTAKANGAGAVVVVNGQGRAPTNFLESANSYIPIFITDSYESGMELLEAAAANGGYIRFTGLASQINQMNGTSSRGPVSRSYEIKPDVIAPGTNVLSTVPAYATGNPNNNTDYGNAYMKMSGTSMASPHVAGISALMLSYSRERGENGGNGWSPLEIKARLMNTAEKMGLSANPFLLLSPSSLVLGITEEAPVNISFSSTASQYDGAEITWSIEDTTVADFAGDPAGKTSARIAGKKLGQTKLTAEVTKAGLPTLTAGSNIYVSNKVTGLTLSPEVIDIMAGTSMSASVGQRTITPEIIPGNADDKSVTWAHSNSFVTSLWPQTDGTLEIKGYLPYIDGSYWGPPWDGNNVFAAYDPDGIYQHLGGRSTITATTGDGGYTAKTVVNVLNGTNGITVHNIITGFDYFSSLILAKGETYQVQAELNASARLAGYDTITWSSSDRSVATVDSNGLITAVNPGEWGAGSTITMRAAKSGSPTLSKTFDVAVTDDSQPAVYYRPATVVGRGQTDASIVITLNQAAVDAGYELVYMYNGGESYDWASGETVYNCSADYDKDTGVLTLKMTNDWILPEPFDITLSFSDPEWNSLTASMKIVPDKSFLTLNESNLTLAAGEDAALFSSLSEYGMEHGYDPAVEWESSDPDRVTVDANGIITALAPTEKPVTVTATSYNGNGQERQAHCNVTVTEPAGGFSAFGPGAYSLDPEKNRIQEGAISYSVYDVGAGFINPVSAIYAESYVTVDTTYFYSEQDSNGAKSGKGQTASFNFGLTKAEMDIDAALSAVVHSQPGKRFSIECVFNTAGRNVKDPTGLFALNLPGEVTVGADGTASFAAAIQSLRQPTEDDPGSYEGYIYLTNKEEPDERYSLPFALYVRSAKPLVDMDSIFLNKPVISTGDNIQAVGFSNAADLYFAMNHHAYSMYFGIIDSANFDRCEDETAWLGIGPIALQFDTSLVLGQMILQLGVLDGYYYVYQNIGGIEGYWGYLLPEGHYKLVLAVDGGLGIEYFPIDFIVDNTVPEITLNDADAEDPFLVRYETDDSGRYTLTGNIHDANIDYMNEIGMKFDIYNSPEDTHSPVPDQTYNLIAAKIKGETYKIAEIGPNGDFAIDLTGLTPGGDTTVELYTYDNFTVNVIYQDYLDLILFDGFHPDMPCYQERYGLPYGFYGTNKKVYDLVLRQEGPALSVNTLRRTMVAGETYQLTFDFNGEAVNQGYDGVTWSSGNPNVAAVDANGLVTALKEGRTTIKLTSNGTKPINAFCEVTVVGINDGVEMSVGQRVNLGKARYPYVLANRTYGPVSEWDWVAGGLPGQKRSMEWTVMGSELDKNGESDGYLTLMAGFGMESLPFGDSNRYSDSQIAAWLNETFYDGLFSPLEESLIVPVDVVTGSYDENGELIPGTEETLESQKLYIPWGTASQSSENMVHNVYWSAGASAIKDNTIRRNASVEAELGYNQMVLSNTMLPQVSYYLRNPADGGKAGIVDETGRVAESETGVNRAVRPIVKLDTSNIVYALNHAYGIGTGLDSGFTDTLDGFYPKFLEGYHLKLTVQGSDEGASVGSVTGLDLSDRSILQGENFAVSFGISSGGTGSRIAYKIVGEADGERSIIKYNVLSGSTRSIDFGVKEFDPGEYRIYIWRQTDNAQSSHEAGEVVSFTLNIQNHPDIPKGVSDGVSLNAGDYVYYSAYNHYTGSGYESAKTPVLWRVMGEETDITLSGKQFTDGYITIMSEYSVMRDNLTSHWSGSTLKETLNTTFFTQSFSSGEQNAVPFFDVKTGWWVQGGTAEGDINTARNQRVYMPWNWTDFIWEFGDSGPSVCRTNVYWSANDKLIQANALSPRPVDNLISNNPELAYNKATCKNGTAAAYLSRVFIYEWPDFIHPDGRGEADPYTGQGAKGVRPITKLTPEAIVYASRITEFDGNYREPFADKDYYKLTVIGYNGGEDIGTLNTGEPVWDGMIYRIPNVTSTENGGGYTIAYKVVGDGADGKREIVGYGEVDTSSSAQDITIDMSAYNQGEKYDVYLWLQKNNELNSNEAGVVVRFDTVRTINSDVSCTTTVKTIVAGYAANLPVEVVFSGEPAGLALGLYDPSNKRLSTIEVSENGKYMFRLDASDAVAGIYTIKAVGAADGVSINCVEQPDDLWAPVVTVDSGTVTVTFASEVTFNEARKNVKIGGATVVSNRVGASGKVITITGVAAVEGQQIVIAGVKYADLFPSYSFTFTLSIP